MTLAKDKKIKISIFVEDEAVGGFIVMPHQYDENIKFINAISNNAIDRVIHFEKNGKVYEVGSIFNEGSNSFESNSKQVDVPQRPDVEFFGIISNSELIRVDRFDMQTLESFVAAYQSNPRFEVEEISINDR